MPERVGPVAAFAAYTICAPPEHSPPPLAWKWDTGSAMVHKLPALSVTFEIRHWAVLNRPTRRFPEDGNWMTDGAGRPCTIAESSSVCCTCTMRMPGGGGVPPGAA